MQEAPSAQDRAAQCSWADPAVTRFNNYSVVCDCGPWGHVGAAKMGRPVVGERTYETQGPTQVRLLLSLALGSPGSLLSAWLELTEHTCCCSHVGASGEGHLGIYPGSRCPKNRQHCFFEESCLQQ